MTCSKFLICMKVLNKNGKWKKENEDVQRRRQSGRVAAEPGRQIRQP